MYLCPFWRNIIIVKQDGANVMVRLLFPRLRNFSARSFAVGEINIRFQFSRLNYIAFLPPVC